MTTKPVAEIVAELRFHRVSDHSPTPHYLWLVYREGHGYFHAMPCYGMHNPWWVPRNNITGEESSPIDMLDSDLWSDGIPTFTDRAELTRLTEENERLKGERLLNGGQYERALRNAPEPLARQDYTDYESNVKLLIMRYGEWYENEVMPLLRRPNPAHGAPRPRNHNQKG